MKETCPNTVKKLFFIIICSLSIIKAGAQNIDTTKTFHVFVEPYLMFTSMSGTTAVGRAPNTFVCVPASEVFSHLKIGGMLYTEVHNKNLAFTSDLFYANLTQDASSKNGVINGTAKLKQFIWELEGMYRLLPWLEAGVGARINSIQVGLNTTTVLGNSSDTKTNSWVDPVIVTRLSTRIKKKWFLSLRTDIGGFGVGSQFAWQIQPDIFYSASKVFQFGLGYRLISTNYYNGTKGTSNYFLFDMNEYGPQVRIGINL